MAEGLADRAYPAVVCEVGRRSGPMWRQAMGRLSYVAEAPACTETTIFDLASLTKVIATTTIVMYLERIGQLSLSTPVRDLLPGWAIEGAAGVTVRHLLEHSAGFAAHERLWERADNAADLRRAVLQMPLERAPGTAAVYSDIGFMLLGFTLETVAARPLEALWQQLWPAGAAWLGFQPSATQRRDIAPTEDDPWRGRILQGEVHDEHAALLGGVAAHAGLFGGADAVGQFAATVLASFHQPSWLTVPDQMRRFAMPSIVPGSSRALGWDTMLPTSSCGTRLSPSAIGHTGFTGTSLWIDWERDLYVVILTNRVHPTRSNERFPPMRARMHDAVVADLESGG